MKFGQFIGWPLEILFLKNYTKNVMEKPVPDPFIKDQNLEYL